MKRVLPILQKKRGAAADKNAVAFVGRSIDDTLCQPEDDVSIQKLQAVNIEASLEAAAQE